MVAYKETPTTSHVDDFHFERVVSDKRHVVDITLGVTPLHIDGQDESKPVWAVATHHKDPEQVIRNIFFFVYI
jgi:hypothetical protein